jgi:hypothetical protein
MREACRVTQRSDDTLRDTTWCIANEIKQRRAKTGVRKGKRVLYFFNEADCVAFAQRKPRAELPPERMTVVAAAGILGVGCDTVRTLCRTGILDADRGNVPGGRPTSVIKGWRPTRKSVKEAWEIIRVAPNRITAGRMLRDWARGRQLSTGSSATERHGGHQIRRRGAPRDPEVLKRRYFCWSERAKGNSLKIVLRAAQSRFGGDSLTSIAEVSRDIRIFVLALSKADAGDEVELATLHAVGLDPPTLLHQFRRQK